MSETYWQCAECDLVYTHSDGFGVTERFEPKVCMECRDDEDDPVPLYPVDVVKRGTVAALRASRDELVKALREIDKGFYNHDLTVRGAQRLARAALARAEKGE